MQTKLGKKYANLIAKKKSRTAVEALALQIQQVYTIELII